MGLIDRIKNKSVDKKRDGQQSKAGRKIKKAVKKEVHKRGSGSRYGGWGAKELHQNMLHQKRRAKNKARRKLIQVEIKKRLIAKRRNKKYRNPNRAKYINGTSR